MHIPRNYFHGPKNGVENKVFVLRLHLNSKADNSFGFLLCTMKLRSSITVFTASSHCFG